MLFARMLFTGVSPGCLQGGIHPSIGAVALSKGTLWSDEIQCPSQACMCTVKNFAGNVQGRLSKENVYSIAMNSPTLSSRWHGMQMYKRRGKQY